MFQRIAYGSLAIAVILAAVVVDVGVAQLAADWDHPLGHLLERGSVLPLLVLVMVCGGAVELNGLLRKSGATPHSRFAFAMIAAMVVTPWLSAAGWLGHGPAQVEGLYWQVVWLIVVGVGMSVVTIARGRAEGTLRDCGATMLMIVYLGFLGSFALQIRCDRDTPDQEGAWLLLITLLVIKSSDIGAYFAGSFLGRHKLIPSISPAKTVEGAIGGLVGSAGVAMAFAALGSKMAQLVSGGAAANWIKPDSRFFQIIEDATWTFGFAQNPHGLHPLARACLFGLAMSAAGQLGDLFESCFKRDANVKDSGRIMPRFGGILDLIDSPVLALPIAWFLLTGLWHVI